MSAQNALVKRAASLRQRKFREREGAFLVEGADLVLAGLGAGLAPQIVFVRAEQADELVELLGLDGREAGGGAATPAGPPPAVYPVSERVAVKVTTLETPPDVMAVFPLPPRLPLTALLGPGSSPKTPALRGDGAAGDATMDADDGQGAAEDRRPGLVVLYSDGVQDPGNLGTLVRAAAPGSADLYGPKAIRASMGAVFAVPLFPEVTLAEVVRQLRLEHVYGLVAHEGTPLADAGLRRPAVLVVGAERAGLSRSARRLVTERVTIPIASPTADAVESLNAGVAGAIALYEFSRRPAGDASDDPSRRPPAPQEG